MYTDNPQGNGRMFDGMRAFRKRIAAGERLLGPGVTFGDPLISEALSHSADFLWYDLEHMLLNPESLNAHLAVARQTATASFVRVADSKPAVVKPVLDAGAEGIVLAQVRTVEEAETFVSNCHYPPQGQRGAGPRIPSNYDRAGLDYFPLANETLFVAVMIETAEAMEAIDEIVKIEHLDGVVIGPFDLSIALGHMGQLTHPVVENAMQSIIDAARGAGIVVGAGMGADAAFAQGLFNRGLHWAQAGCDFHFLVQCFDTLCSELTKLQKA